MLPFEFFKVENPRGVDTTEEPLRNPKHSSAPFRTPLRNAPVAASLSDMSSLLVFTFLRPPTVCCGLFSTCHVTLAPKRNCWRRSERWWLPTRTHVESTSRACPTSRPASRSLWGTVPHGSASDSSWLLLQLHCEKYLEGNKQVYSDFPKLRGRRLRSSVSVKNGCSCTVHGVTPPSKLGSHEQANATEIRTQNSHTWPPQKQVSWDMVAWPASQQPVVSA